MGPYTVLGRQSSVRSMYTYEICKQVINALSTTKNEYEENKNCWGRKKYYFKQVRKGLSKKVWLWTEL